MTFTNQYQTNLQRIHAAHRVKWSDFYTSFLCLAGPKHIPAHLVQLYFDSKFLATSRVLEKPFFEKLPCNNDVLLPGSFYSTIHFIDDFDTKNKAKLERAQLKNLKLVVPENYLFTAGNNFFFALNVLVCLKNVLKKLT